MRIIIWQILRPFFLIGILALCSYVVALGLGWWADTLPPAPGEVIHVSSSIK